MKIFFIIILTHFFVFFSVLTVTVLVQAKFVMGSGGSALALIKAVTPPDREIMIIFFTTVHSQKVNFT